MHHFQIGDRVYVLDPSDHGTARMFGKVVDVWSSGRYVDVQFDGHQYSWPFMSIHVYHADHETTREVINHVNC